MTKDELLGCFSTVRNNYALVLTSIIFLCEENAANVFVDRYDQLPIAEVDFRYVEGIIRDDERLRLGTGQLQKMIHRAALKELFELLRHYCHETKQMSLFKSAPWYQFARIARNSLSHNYRLEFKKYDMSVLPVTWDGLTIDASMDGKYLPMEEFFTRPKLWTLIGEMELYVGTTLA